MNTILSPFQNPEWNRALCDCLFLCVLHGFLIKKKHLMCLFGSFFQSKKYAFMYWKGESVFYCFLFSSKKGGRKERNTKSVFELIFSWFWKGLFSHIDCSLCFENSYVTPSVPHSHSVNAGWGLKSTPPLAILYWASQALLGCPVDLSKSCRFTVSYPGQFSGVRFVAFLPPEQLPKYLNF